MAMISTWSEWKRYPRPGRGENIEAPIMPGIYEVRYAATGALHSFGAVDNVAQALAMLSIGGKSWFGRRGSSEGRGGTHDRPARNLYERRGLIGLSITFQNCLKPRRCCARCIVSCLSL